MASSGLKFLRLELAFQCGCVTGLKDLCTEKFGGKCRVTADKRILSALGAQMLSALSIYIFKNLRENSVWRLIDHTKNGIWVYVTADQNKTRNLINLTCVIDVENHGALSLSFPKIILNQFYVIAQKIHYEKKVFGRSARGGHRPVVFRLRRNNQG